MDEGQDGDRVPHRDLSQDRTPADAAGEAVCWIGLLCPECGAMPEGAGAEAPDVPCWRCGTLRSQVRGD